MRWHQRLRETANTLCWLSALREHGDDALVVLNRVRAIVEKVDAVEGQTIR